jgi:hypothetical protein
MKEIEKRLGLGAAEAMTLKEKIASTLPLVERVPRTILIKTGEGFVPDPDSLVDIKVKLIGDQSILSVKHGSWHGDAERREYETRFQRSDLPQLLGSLSILPLHNFILLSSLRSVWQSNDCMLTLDEYTNTDKALFEAEALGTGGEASVDQVFSDFGIAPMDSPATITFIEGVNQSRDVQINFHERSPEEVAALMLRSHPC